MLTMCTNANLDVSLVELVTVLSHCCKMLSVSTRLPTTYKDKSYTRQLVHQAVLGVCIVSIITSVAHIKSGMHALE